MKKAICLLAALACLCLLSSCGGDFRRGSVKKTPGKPKSSHDLGKKFFVEGKYKEALQEFEKAWADNPSDPETADWMLKVYTALESRDKEDSRPGGGNVVIKKTILDDFGEIVFIEKLLEKEADLYREMYTGGYAPDHGNSLKWAKEVVRLSPGSDGAKLAHEHVKRVEQEQAYKKALGLLRQRKTRDAAEELTRVISLAPETEMAKKSDMFLSMLSQNKGALKIKIGQDPQEIVNAYGKPDRRGSTNTQVVVRYMIYDKLGIKAELYHNKTFVIVMGKMYMGSFWGVRIGDSLEKVKKLYPDLEKNKNSKFAEMYSAKRSEGRYQPTVTFTIKKGRVRKISVNATRQIIGGTLLIMGNPIPSLYNE